MSLLDQLAAVPSPNNGSDKSADERVAKELGSIQARFQQAAEKLKNARFPNPDGQPRTVEEMPWYVMIGAPGSGKTTALLNSGLRFPLYTADSSASVPGVGRTRNCDWWFAEEAVLIDTAGRYTTQESDRKADAAAWHGFLALLRQFRPERPLNGALVTVSVLDLMLWTKNERAKFAAHVRMRLSEMYAALNQRFPVYVLVTKMDLLAGFTEFFGDYDPTARMQVWGTTFDHDIDPALIALPYAADFAALEERLGAEMLARLHEERDLQRRAAIYRFPQQFHPIGPLLGEFVALTFGTQVNHRPLQLRGVYFTSGTQEGNPIDRVLATMARTFRLERNAAALVSGTGKSFFVTRLLRDVVFPEHGLAAVEETLPVLPAAQETPA
ncbi:MAG: type VI secretion system membrane subunit TssM [Betaproteobacteria bacterium]|nr:type VI secretion system membrane subunit TssM [Betaproteobacteria bacterium]